MRFTATFRRAVAGIVDAGRFAVAGIADAGRAAGVFTATFLSRLTATLLRARTSALLSRLTAKFLSRLTEEFLAVAGVVDTGRVVRLTAELVLGAAYDRCRFCAAETLRCARAVAGIADAGRAAVAGLAA